MQSLFYKLCSNFSIFTVLNKLLSILLYNKKIYQNGGTIRHYVKQHKNNVKVVHTKGTIMTRNNFTEAGHPKAIQRKDSQKYTTHPQKTTHADAQIQ